TYEGPLAQLQVSGDSTFGMPHVPEVAVALVTRQEKGSTQGRLRVHISPSWARGLQVPIVAVAEVTAQPCPAGQNVVWLQTCPVATYLEATHFMAAGSHTRSLASLQTVSIAAGSQVAPSTAWGAHVPPLQKRPYPHG